MRLFHRQGEKKAFSEALEKRNIPFEYVKESNCFIYADEKNQKTLRIYEKEGSYFLEGKEYEYNEILSELERLEAENQKIMGFQDERYADFWNICDFFKPIFENLEMEYEIFTSPNRITLKTDLIQVSETILDGVPYFSINPGQSYEDSVSTAVRLFEKLFDTFENRRDTLLQYPKDGFFSYYIKRYLLSRVLMDKINELMNSEAQITDNFGTLLIMLKNGSCIEYRPPCQDSNTAGYIIIQDFNKMKQAADNEDFNMVIKILKLTELIVPAR